MDRSRNEPPPRGGADAPISWSRDRSPPGGNSEAPGGPPATRWWRPRRLRSGAPTGAGRGHGAPRPCGGGGDRSGAGGDQPRVDGRSGGSVSRPVESSSGKREAPGGRSAGRHPPSGRGWVPRAGPAPRSRPGATGGPWRSGTGADLRLPLPPRRPPPQIMAPRPRPRNRSQPPGSSRGPGRRLRRIGSAWSDGPVRPPASSNGERNGRPEDPHPGVRRLSTDHGGEGRWGRDGGRPHRAGPVAASTGARGGPGSESPRSAKRGGPGHPGTGPKNSSQWPSGSRVKTRFSRASRIRATMGSLRRRSSASHPSTSETRKPRWSNSVPRRCGS